MSLSRGRKKRWGRRFGHHAKLNRVVLLSFIFKFASLTIIIPFMNHQIYTSVLCKDSNSSCKVDSQLKFLATLLKFEFINNKTKLETKLFMPSKKWRLHEVPTNEVLRGGDIPFDEMLSILIMSR